MKMLVPGAEKHVVCIDFLLGLNWIGVDFLRTLCCRTDVCMSSSKETFLRSTSKLWLDTMVAGAEKDAVCIDAMFRFTGSSCEFGIMCSRAWRPRTGVSPSSAKETFLPSTSELWLVAGRILLQGGNSVKECCMVVLQCSFSVRVEIVLLLWHIKQASSVLSISLQQHPWPGFSQYTHSPTLPYWYKLKKLLY